MQSSNRIVSEFFERDDVIDEMLRVDDEKDNTDYSESDSSDDSDWEDDDIESWEDDTESDTEVLDTDSDDDIPNNIFPVDHRRIVDFRLPAPALRSSPPTTFVSISLFSPSVAPSELRSEIANPHVLRRETTSDYIHLPPLSLRRETPSDYSPPRITPRRAFN